MTTISNFIEGHLSTSERLWTSLGPLVGLGVFVTAGAIAYAVRNARHGAFHDAEMASRGATALVGMRLRMFFSWLMAPFWKALLLARVSANAITLLSVLLALGAGLAVAQGRFALGGWLYLATGLCDFFDGRIARASGQSSPRGAVLDSVVDRYTEGAMIAGLVWFYRNEWTAILALVALTGSFLVPYVRARGEAAGARFHNVGLMQRPERVVLLGVTVALAPAFEVLVSPPATWPSHALTAAGIAVLALSSQLTAVERLSFVLKSVPGPNGDREPAEFMSKTRKALLGVVEISVEAALIALLVRAHVAPTLALVVGTTFGVATRVRFDERGSASRWRVVFVSISTAILVMGGTSLVVATGFVSLALAWAITRFLVAVVWERSLGERTPLAVTPAE